MKLKWKMRVHTFGSLRSMQHTITHINTIVRKISVINVEFAVEMYHCAYEVINCTDTTNHISQYKWKITICFTFCCIFFSSHCLSPSFSLSLSLCCCLSPYLWSVSRQNVVILLNMFSLRSISQLEFTH